MYFLKYIKKPKPFFKVICQSAADYSRIENPANFIPRSLRLSRIPNNTLIFNKHDLEMVDFALFFFGLFVATPTC